MVVDVVLDELTQVFLFPLKPQLLGLWECLFVAHSLLGEPSEFVFSRLGAHGHVVDSPLGGSIRATPLSAISDEGTAHSDERTEHSNERTAHSMSAQSN